MATSLQDAVPLQFLQDASQWRKFRQRGGPHFASEVQGLSAKQVQGLCICLRY